MAYEFFSFASTSATGVDILIAWKTAVDADYPDGKPFVIKKLTLICDSAQAVKLNTAVNFSDLYEDPADNKFKLSLDTDDVRISKLEFETGSVAYHVAFLF